ncbi:ABC-2 type transport system ATP-binding protein [Eubacterium uniforme]|uniref:ABC-2 type transport system ATP-binding protein n=1 Tax=Eubacterium uniforme TaxID=39495 RepID=A0A1T4V3X4_9FIRM|nr:ABC transporter ATP-binding protein [Eubacterium uniforme]SKA59645.1 ABC-2 type transport system ATP-binding protein [Eubacterium uniforme]
MKLVLEEIFKKFDDKVVIADTGFTFESGKIYGLLGRNGAGKTTLFNIINDDIKAEHGKVYLTDDEGNTRKLDIEDIGYVISAPVVPNFLTGREMLKFFIEINQKRIKDLKTIDEYFDMVSIDEADRYRLAKDYSHGMKNKMMMLLNFISNPDVWLLDEPLTSLDVVVADEMKQLLRTMKGDHIMILSTHIMELATGLCDEIVLLKDGKLLPLDKGDMTKEEFEKFIIDILKSDYSSEGSAEEVSNEEKEEVVND